MYPISWQDSGKGQLELTLADAQRLAVQGGFVFVDDETIPLNKNANLQSKHDPFVGAFGMKRLAFAEILTRRRFCTIAALQSVPCRDV